MTIQQHYGRADTIAYNSKHGVTEGVPLPDWLVGLELEIEGWPHSMEQRFGGMSFTEDGSLRATAAGRGVEAITKPVAIKYVPKMLSAFYKHFSITESNYSERCSTHVHFNVEPLEFSHISTIALVYQTVERLLFDFVGHDRGNNIFCVPWYQCNLSYNIVSQIEKSGHDVFRRWQKYSALNLIPIVEQGTVEFRHLHGTCDVDLITNWICLLAKIVEYSQKVELDVAQKLILNMNTVSNYHQWLHSVFGDFTGLLQRDGFEQVLSKGVIDSKLSLMKPKEKKRGIYDQMLDQMIAGDLMIAPREHGRQLEPPVIGLVDDPWDNVIAALPRPVLRRGDVFLPPLNIQPREGEF